MSSRCTTYVVFFRTYFNMLLLPAALLVCLIFQHSGQKDCITAIFTHIWTYLHTYIMQHGPTVPINWGLVNMNLKNEWIEIMFFWIFESLEMWCDFTEEETAESTKMSRRNNFLGSRLKKQKCTEEVIWLGFLASLETSPTTYPKIKKSLFCYLV